MAVDGVGSGPGLDWLRTTGSFSKDDVENETYKAAFCHCRKSFAQVRVAGEHPAARQPAAANATMAARPDAAAARVHCGTE